ncbi:MAG: carotenoid 1,2-hydratase [Polyangiaceae bacterium]|nr:carotenoid 1,2-hydratase [Polyangiaceae bacterium]
MSDDGSMAIVIIAMLGNPFSAAYAAARARGPAPALSFCSMNIAVYGRRASAWCLEERRVTPLHRSGSGVAIGASAMRWRGDDLIVEIDERTTPVLWPFRSPVRGRLILRPETLSGLDLTIDAAGQHRWWPVAPLARIEVELSEPDLRFSGHGYHDANAGELPLEATFDAWNWSRARTPRGAVIAYDAEERSGARRSTFFRLTPDGQREDLGEAPPLPLPSTRYLLPRSTHADRSSTPQVLRRLEDSPFYARSLLQVTLDGQPAVSMHESLSLQRFREPWVQRAIPYRMRSVSI